MAIVLGNSRIQVMCIPTLWAGVVLTICFGVITFYPLLIQRKKMVLPVSFIAGFSFCVLLYCILFLEWISLYGIPMVALFGLGLLVLMPQFLFIQLFWKFVVRPVSKRSRLFFSLGLVPAICIIFLAGRMYSSASSALVRSAENGFETVDQNFMTEKILGMHFIYHTRFCEFDGWRPPKHEPLLVIGMWMNGREDPLQMDLSERLALYRRVFPNNQVKFRCSCASAYSQSYHNSHLWKD